MYTKIKELSEQYLEQAIKIRRDLHMYPEVGWLEVRTASIVAHYLEELGYEIKIGEDIMVAKERMGMPSKKVFELNTFRALKEGAYEEYVPKLKDGMTAVAGILKCGEGPTVALRFDMDALNLKEMSTTTPTNYSSRHPGIMHACGHDGHVSIGIMCATLLSQIKDELHGTIKIIFQPAEEGVRGAKCIVESGFLDDVDYIMASHIMPQIDCDYDLYFGMNHSFATTKLDVLYHGVSTHASEAPQFGKNALLSAANCILNLHSIPRNSDGCTRVNVGTVKAGTSRNVVPETASLELEVRGETTELNKYMECYARDIIRASAFMHDTVVEIKEMGHAPAINCNKSLMDLFRKTASENMPDLILPKRNVNPLGGSDDFALMMERVQQNGGKATYLKLLTPMTSSLHCADFDFDEKALSKGIRLLSSFAYTLLKEKSS